MTRSPLRKPARRAKPVARPQPGMALHTLDGARKYLTTGERDAFLRAAEEADRQVRTLCMTLAYAGCRLSEALALTVDRVDLAAGQLVLESLKKRRSGVYRAVPVPPEFLDLLAGVHSLPQPGCERLWGWSRATAWRRVCEVMDAAGITGLHATPKGLRHGFGIRCVSSGVQEKSYSPVSR